MKQQGSIWPDALSLLESNLKTTLVQSTDARPVTGVAPAVSTSIICGECGDDGGGSSGQCACDK